MWTSQQNFLQQQLQQQQQQMPQYGDPRGLQYGSAPTKPSPTRFLSGITQQRQSLNVFAVALSVFVPWLLFTMVLAMLSFELHFRMPFACRAAVVFAVIALVVFAATSFVALTQRRFGTENDPGTKGGPSWSFFLATTSLVALFLAIAIGNRNFAFNLQPYYDLENMNNYDQVDPSAMKGQELMDAGRVKFADGVSVDVAKSMGFKNQDVYCVAPISQGTAPLESYDFWSVGKNCCTEGGTNFTCGDLASKEAQQGLRWVHDEDRAFFRLAVQQAQSAYAIKAVHPLFFYWTEDAEKEMHSYRQDGYKYYLLGMFCHLGFQIGLVYAAARSFKMIGHA